VNLAFMSLGVLLTLYAQQHGIDAHKDELYPILVKDYLGPVVFIAFIIGLIAAAFSSSDSALTSLTTSFSVDILEIDKKHTVAKQVRIRKRVHMLIALTLIFVIISFKYLIKDESVIAKLFIFTGYTYGPLLGLYSFGLFTRLKTKDKLIPYIALSSPVLAYLISLYSDRLFGFDFGFFVLILNGVLTFTGLLICSDFKSGRQHKSVLTGRQ